jgi:hypothetical protein
MFMTISHRYNQNINFLTYFNLMPMCFYHYFCLYFMCYLVLFPSFFDILAYISSHNIQGIFYFIEYILILGVFFTIQCSFIAILKFNCGFCLISREYQFIVLPFIYYINGGLYTELARSCT